MDDKKYTELLKESFTKPITEADVLREFKVGKDTLKKVANKMVRSLKTDDASKRKTVSSMLPKKNLIQSLLKSSIKGKEKDFKKSQSYFKSFFKSIKNDKLVSNLSNAMACISVATDKGDIMKTSKNISKKIESKMKKRGIQESENLNEFAFPTIQVIDEESAGGFIINIIAGVLQLVVEIGLMTLAYTATGFIGAPVLVFIALWLLWACLPENLQDWWIVIPI